MAIDKTTIINWALTEIGAGPMFSTDDDSDLAAQIENVWQMAFDQCFGMHDWTFARVTVKMLRLAETPENGWAYGYMLPEPRIGNPLAYRRGARYSDPLIRDFTLQGGMFFTCEPEAWAVHKTPVNPDYWEPSFRAAFVTALSGWLAVPVWSDEDMRDRKLAEAFGSPSMQGSGGKFGRLMAQDKGSAPIGEEPLLRNDPLTDVRGLGGGPLSGPWHGGL
ncbi:hypothetical protein B5P46_11850 [Rhizobium leguminosarum]|uniref:Uncharacterized protein n=1 Tax=Rhizobium leguminosarum TaxID=384 RepID=A0A4Q1UET9_RHILE|nr:hypothetical protein [Rhizobium leguminosarum]RXT29368.1 hypothetical protein B5P46_11850 [Rhizobium leguminosarum]